MKSSCITFLLFVCLTLTPLAAQSNRVLDGFLDSELADAGTSLLLIAQATGQLEDSATPEDGLQWAQQQKWGKKMNGLSASDTMPLGKFHLALFQSFSIKGGIGYTLFKDPRSAAREAGYQKFVTGIAYVNHMMTPDEVLESISRALELKEDEE